MARRRAAQGADGQDPQARDRGPRLSATVTLRDGSQVRIRPIEPDDREAFAAGFERLSPESRYRRFFGPMPKLRERDLDYLTRVDHHDHEALVAFDEATGDGIGVARFARVAPDAAEPAIAVVDDWQRRGVASALLAALAERAREEGVIRFEAPVLATNREAMRALERLGETTRRPLGREVELRIELAEAPGPSWPLWPVLRGVAAGSLAPARTLLDRIWPRRSGEPGDERRNVIVVGTDGSEHARAAADAAVALAHAGEAIVHVVGVDRFFLADRQEVEAAVRAVADVARERGLHVHTHVRRGDPAFVLVDVAVHEDARLLVVGAGAGGGVTRRLLGGVADAVAERAPCDVLIVRPPV